MSSSLLVLIVGHNRITNNYCSFYQYSDRRELGEQMVIGPVRREQWVLWYGEYELIGRTAGYQGVQIRAGC